MLECKNLASFKIKLMVFLSRKEFLILRFLLSSIAFLNYMDTLIAIFFSVAFLLPDLLDFVHLDHRLFFLFFADFYFGEVLRKRVWWFYVVCLNISIHSVYSFFDNALEITIQSHGRNLFLHLKQEFISYFA